MNVLALGNDPSLFPAADRSCHIGDARRRHAYYADRLVARFPGSELRTLTYTPRGSGEHCDSASPGLKLWGTASRHRALYLLGVILRLPELLADGWRPDVVTVQTPWEEGVVGWLLARWTGARFIPQLHFDLFSADWLGEHPLNAWRRRVARLILRRADRIRVVSEALRRRTAAELGIPPRQIDVAPVGVNFVAASGERSCFKAAIAEALVHRPMVLFVGRLCAQKNLPLWIDVAARVAQSMPEAAFVIVGDGPDEAAIRRRAEAELDDRILFLGRKPHAELPMLYAAADVFLLTSHYEGFGRVILEAQLAGLPVVSTACTGPEDLIEDGRSGRLLPMGDLEGLANAVIELLEDPAVAARLGGSGRARAEQDFNLAALTDRMIDCWEKVR